jgi:hypothetical protein
VEQRRAKAVKAERDMLGERDDGSTKGGSGSIQTDTDATETGDAEGDEDSS